MGMESHECQVISSNPCSKVFVTFPIDLRRRMAIEEIREGTAGDLKGGGTIIF